MERKGTLEASLHSSGLLPGTMSLRCPLFLLKTNTLKNTLCDKAVKNWHTYTHLEKPVKRRLHVAHLSDYLLTIFSNGGIVTGGNLNSLCSMSILVRQHRTSDRYSLLNEGARCQTVRELKRGETKEKGSWGNRIKNTVPWRQSDGAVR